jgi:hypothetical protein
MAESSKKDRLGEFLTQYDEYLDGQRSYSELPVFPGGDADASTPSTQPKPPSAPSRPQAKK